MLFVCADPVGVEMAGLGIRNWELAQVVRRHAEVTIAHGGDEALDDGDLRAVPYRPHDPGTLTGLIDDADVVVAHPQWSPITRQLRRSGARIVFDLYDPETLETLELLSGRPRLARRQLTATTLDRLHDALRSGHHFMCAAENQRDLWLGAMLGLRFIGPDAYDRDPSLRSVIDVVPFGLPSEPPRPIGVRGPRDVLDGVGLGDELVLWNGGIWRWLDAPTAIRAVATLSERRPRIKLVFMGAAGDHPAAQRSAAQARELARDLGLLDRSVIFGEHWVPYGERGQWLAQADCAIAASRDHLETRFAFRTRLLDCFWAGLPVACTTGDELAARVERDGLGAVAPVGDPGALAAALERVLSRGRDAYAPALRAAAARSTWSHAAEPLLRWIDQPPPEVRAAGGATLGKPLAQRLRETAYESVARPLLARRLG